jgi:nuclear autoantigenic sperm protein
LEVAWEVLQNAALIFQRQEDKGLKNLLEVYNEMAGISIENGNFSLALDDYSRALTTFDCLDDDEKNDRIAAEIYYKIGLCQSMEKSYDESVTSFKKAHDLIAGVIEKEKAKKDQTEDIKESIQDMEETQKEIMNKITEIGEIKADEIEAVKRELAKLYGGMNGAGSDPGAGCSSSSAPAAATPAASKALKSPEAEKPKPTDISHLIKRKKPDSDAVESSPAKKMIVETSPGADKPTAVAIEEEKKKVEETATVQVVLDN